MGKERLKCCDIVNINLVCKFFSLIRTPWGDLWKSDTNIYASISKSSGQLSVSSQLSTTRKSLQTSQPIREVQEPAPNAINDASSEQSSLSSVIQSLSSIKDEVRKREIFFLFAFILPYV